MAEKPFVWVASSAGWCAHGPARASEKQALSVARALGRRLGWVCAVGAVAPAACPAVALAPALAGLSPVWRDPVLAAVWAGVAPVAVPVADPFADIPAPAAE